MERPITPPDELVRQWPWQWICCLQKHDPDLQFELQRYIAAQASQWGWDQRGAANEAELQQRADQELEACEEWVEANFGQLPAHNLHQFRRPKPPSIKDQALEAAQRFYAQGHDGCTDEEIKADFDAICRALRRLEELEAAHD